MITAKACGDEVGTKCGEMMTYYRDTAEVRRASFITTTPDPSINHSNHSGRNVLRSVRLLHLHYAMFSVRDSIGGVRSR